MEGNNTIAQLFDLAAEYKLSEFHTLFTKNIAGFGKDAVSEAHLLRAQLKLMSSDETAVDDLRLAADAGITPERPCLYTQWLPQDPNSFVVFNRSAGALASFLDSLPEAGGLMRRFYGEAGEAMVNQIHSEVLYFTCRPNEALGFAVEHMRFSKENCAGSIMAGYVLFRCNLLLGRAGAAQRVMMKIIKSAKDNPGHPTCSKIYETVRNWANLTTGWSGDTPRYHYTPDNVVLPVLEDRTAAIQKGINALGPTERPFAEYAALNYSGAYTLRQLYMDVFYAVYYFRGGMPDNAVSHFEQAYNVSLASGIIMPFVEYGMQILPLLKYVKEKSGRDKEWAENIIYLSKNYEESLNAFRDYGEK